MMVTSEKGVDASAGYTKSRLAQLESMLQELRKCEEHKRQQNVESAAELVAQDELAAAQASKAELCAEIGALKQSKEHQAKQIDKYKLDLQAARESQAAMTKKMGELETSTWTIKQQYIRSLASRIKTSALVLQQLNGTNGVELRARIAGTCSEWEPTKPNKRKRVMEDNVEQQECVGDDKILAGQVQGA
ncbi:Transcription factor MYB1R1 [Phytophthora nicotianae]|uniref:Transcription factor MYB1R1 n=1 Tax=Phytophthora nicotianae TaxID=4792 RepID=A0A0W8DSK7_PHYNI|nr:Transcription factor MYB1R1 [Phytophthora nicotianae]